MDACRGADLVTTDVWTSMGFEAENDARQRDFADWQVDADMMRRRSPTRCSCTACRAHRGEEVAADVIDGPQSVVWDEAENRLHAQKALLEYSRLRPHRILREIAMIDHMGISVLEAGTQQGVLPRARWRRSATTS